MPNWVETKFIVRGIASEVDAFMECVKSIKPDEGTNGSFDFNRLIPCPESLQMESGSDTSLGMAILSGEVAGYLSYPWIKELGIVDVAGLRAWAEVASPKVLELGRQALDNVAQHGAATWYEGCLEHWGTKWNACNVSVERDSPEQARFYFDTAWSFAEPVFAKVAERFPAVSLLGEVDEESGFFYGSFEIDGGVLTTSFVEGIRKGGPYDHSDEEEDEADAEVAGSGDLASEERQAAFSEPSGVVQG